MKYITLLLLLTSGCAHEPYWTRVVEPLEVKHIVRVDRPCGDAKLWGCFHWPSQTIEIRKGLSPVADACVLGHERKHAAGYKHDNERPSYSIDCGDGTRYIPL